MNQREKLLAFAFGAVIVGWLGWGLVDSWFIQPIRERSAKLASLETDLSKNLGELSAARDAVSDLSNWRRQALPADISLAQTLYLDYLRKSLAKAEVDLPTIRPSAAIRKANDFSRLPVSIDAKASLRQLTEFLHDFHSAPFLQEIKRLRIQPVLKDDRIETYDLSISVEAISMPDSFAKDRLPTHDDLAEGGVEVSSRPLEQFKLFERKDPFQPTEVVTASEPPREMRDGPFARDERDEYYVTATLMVDGIREAWLTHRGSQVRKVLHEGEPLAIGGMEATVLKIEPDEIVLQIDDKVGEVGIGRNLASWKATGDAPVPIPLPGSPREESPSAISPKEEKTPDATTSTPSAEPIRDEKADSTEGNANQPSTTGSTKKTNPDQAPAAEIPATPSPVAPPG